MKILLYWLIKNDVPYYVGVTTLGNRRYSGIKKEEIVFIEEYSNRIDARIGEEYWIWQLRSWGFRIENRKTIPTKLAYKENSFVEWRGRISKEQKQKLDKADVVLGVDQSIIVQDCLRKFFKLLNNLE